MSTAPLRAHLFDPPLPAPDPPPGLTARDVGTDPGVGETVDPLAPQPWAELTSVPFLRATQRAQDRRAAPERATAVTIVVPTFNEGANVGALVERLSEVCAGPRFEVLFVDDSTDDTPDVVAAVARSSSLHVCLLHRLPAERTGGLAGAVCAGIRWTYSDVIVVMDGDLQHPPELIPDLLAELDDESVDLVVASRHIAQGSTVGLDGALRRLVSRFSTLLARAAFPLRVGRRCTDPMTGFFAIRRSALDPGRLRPQGFKILLEILARHSLTVREVPLRFDERLAGESKASARQGLAFVRQLVTLRLWTSMVRFGLIGAAGLLANLGLLAAMLAGGMHYLAAAILASEVTILSNFALQERFVFHDKSGSRRLRYRLLHALMINNVEIALRVPLLALLVQQVAVRPVIAQALLIAVGFVGRFLFLDRITYRRIDRTGPSADEIAPHLDVAPSSGVVTDHIPEPVA